METRGESAVLSDESTVFWQGECKCLDAPPFVPYIWHTKTPTGFPGVVIMATPQRSLTGPLLLLNRLGEIESDLRSLLPTADKALRPQLIEALSFVEKANQALQKSVERLT